MDVVADLVSDRPARSPRYVLALLDWLPTDGPTYAAMRGGRHWLGWTPAVAATADLWDLTAAIAVAQGGKPKGRPAPKAPTYPRPAAPRPTPRKPVRSLASFPGAVDTRKYASAT